MPAAPPHARSWTATGWARLRHAGLALIVTALTSWLWLRVTWIADDGLITLRTVHHALAGEGLRFNVDQRVMVSSHPLWLLVQIAAGWCWQGLAVDRVLALSAVCTALTALVVVGAAGLRGAAGWALACCSAAFVTFTSSGLEYPLSYLLGAGCWVLLLRRDATDHAGPALALAGLAVLNRHDQLLLLGPTMVWSARQVTPGGAAWRLAPLLAWVAFAFVYFGTPLPNPAYAKVKPDAVERLEDGAEYLVDFVQTDPAGAWLLLCAAALGAAHVLRQRDRATLLMSAGITLQVLYVVCIGGDFMSGRFFSTPVLAAALLLGHRLSGRSVAGVLAVTACLTAAGPRAPWSMSASDAAVVPEAGPTNERAFYVGRGWLLRARNVEASWREAPHDPTPPGRILVRPILGQGGLDAATEARVVDSVALSSPFLSRLPASGPRHRTGHIERQFPVGYVSSRLTGVDRLADPALGALWRATHLVTTAPLLDAERLAHLPTWWLRRASALPGGHHVDALGRHEIPSEGVVGGMRVFLRGPASHLQLWLTADAAVDLDLVTDLELVGGLRIEAGSLLELTYEPLFAHLDHPNKAHELHLLAPTPHAPLPRVTVWVHPPTCDP